MWSALHIIILSLYPRFPRDPFTVLYTRGFSVYVCFDADRVMNECHAILGRVRTIDNMMVK